MEPASEHISVRPATVADLPELGDLLTLLFTQEADFQPDRARQERGLHLILAQPEVGLILCAAAGTHLAGMVSLLFTVSTAEGGRAAWLEDMIVRPEFRDQGVGKSLLQAAIAAGQAAGCTRITLLTDADNAPAMRFYARAGFQRSAMVPFRLTLRNEVSGLQSPWKLSGPQK